MDKLKQKKQIFIFHQPTTPGDYQFDCSPVKQIQSLPVLSMRDSEGQTAPGWWFHGFEPVWRPFIQWLCRHRKVTVLEFERAASQIPGLTDIEKTIAISAFRQQQEEGLATSRNTTALRSEHSLSAI